MKEINYKNLIDNKLSKQTNEDNGTAYVAIDGQYEEQSGYGYTYDEWITLYEGIPSLAEDEDDEHYLYSTTNIFFTENVSPDSVNNIRLIISGENNHDVTSGITYTSGNTICFGNPYFATFDTEKDNGVPYSVSFQNTSIHISAYDTFITNGDHVTIMSCIPSVKQIDFSLLPANVFVKGEGEYSIQAKNDTSVSATGDYAVAEGFDTQASEFGSHAEGSQTYSTGYASHAEGFSTVGFGDYCHTEGHSTFATSSASHAEGRTTLATGRSSHAEGEGTASYGNYSHAEGSGTVKTLYLTGSDKTYSFRGVVATSLKEGMVVFYPPSKSVGIISSIDETNTSITLNQSLGTLTQQQCKCYFHCASEIYSHVEGYNNIANGTNAHAEGACTSAYGPRSHSEGLYTSAGEIASHAEGYYTKASGQYQHVSGKYNVEDLNNIYAEIIGIGTAESSCKNGRTLDWSGNEQLAGSLTLGLGTTDQVTVTAAQLKQLIALLGGGL